MKVALVCREFFASKGGLEAYTCALSRELRRRGNEVHIFANSWQTEQGMVFHRVPMIPVMSPAKNLSFAFLCARALARESFDVIQSMERIWFQDIYRASDGINPVQMQVRYRRRLLRFVKAAGPRRQALAFLERRIFKGSGCRIIMTNSELIKGQIVAHYRVKPEKIRVVYNGVNRARFHPGVKDQWRRSVREEWGIGEDQNVLLFVGNDFKLKGLQLLLEAMAVMKNEKVRLLVVGNGDRRSYWRWTRKHGLEHQVLFLGSTGEVEKFYAASDLFVLPTLYDAFSNVCLEAMACGTPVITSRNNGASELIRDGEEGYVLERHEVGELAEKVRISLSADKKATMGGRAAIKADGFTVEKHFAALLGLYQEIMDLKGR